MTSKENNAKELEDFILENEEMILEILRKGRSRTESAVCAEVEKGKTLVKGVVEALMDKEVQEHFVRMGFEMLMGIGALIKALPLPEEMSPVVDAMSEKNEVLKDMVGRCQKETGGKKKGQTAEKIDVK